MDGESVLVAHRTRGVGGCLFRGGAIELLRGAVIESEPLARAGRKEGVMRNALMETLANIPDTDQHGIEAALQAHDPESKVCFRDLKVKVLPE